MLHCRVFVIIGSVGLALADQVADRSGDFLVVKLSYRLFLLFHQTEASDRILVYFLVMLVVQHFVEIDLV